MPFIACEKHGGNGSAAVCSHIADSLIGNSKMSFELADLYSVTVDYHTHSLGPLYYCSECAQQYGLQEQHTKLTGDSGLDRMFEMRWAPVCPKCFAEEIGKTK